MGPAASRLTVEAARASSHSQASPTGWLPWPTSQVPSPCPVAFGKARQLGAEIAQGARAVLPCLGKRLGNRAMVAGIVFVANRRGFDLASAEVESDCLEHGRARVDPDDDVTCLTHGGYLPSLTFGFLPRLKIHRSRPRL